MSDEGGAAFLMMALAALLAGLLVAVAYVGLAVAARHQAAAAADASALAAAVATYPGVGFGDPTARAAGVARASGATLEICACPTDSSLRARTVTVGVVLEVDLPWFGGLAVRQRARAEFDPRAWLGL